MAVYKEIRKADGKIVGRGVNVELPQNTDEFEYEWVDGIIDPADVEVYQEPQPVPYNGDTLITWAMAQLFAAELIPHFAAFLDFANKGSDASAANFRAYATAVSLSETAETIIAKAIELGASISNE